MPSIRKTKKRLKTRIKTTQNEEEMNLYRFASNEEYHALLAGKVLHNATDHFKGGRGGSTSKGFCFTEDEPKIAWQYLKGIVTPDICLCFDIPRQLLIKSRGKYSPKPIHHPDGTMTATAVIKDEWCICELRPEWLKQTIRLESFVPDYELEICHAFENLKKHNLPQ